MTFSMIFPVKQAFTYLGRIGGGARVGIKRGQVGVGALKGLPSGGAVVDGLAQLGPNLGSERV